MKIIALSAALMLAALPIRAQTVVEETPEVVVAPQGTASSAGMVVVPMLTLFILAAAIAK